MQRLLLCLTILFLPLYATAGPIEDDIREAVFRHQMGRVDASIYYLALGIHRKGDFIPPSRTFMQRFVGQSNVKPFSGEFLRNNESAVILCIDSVSQNNGQAEAAVRFVFADLTRSSSGFYRLSLQKHGAWKVIRTMRMKIMPVD